MDTTRGERGPTTRFDPTRRGRLVPTRSGYVTEFFSLRHETHLEARALVERREVSAAALGATMALEAVIACMIFI